MGREVKRVPEDFNWPIHKKWEGFLNPHYQHRQNCPFCKASGLNPATKKLSDEWYGWDNEDWVPYSYKRPDGSIHEKRYNNNAWCHHITQNEVNSLIKHNRLMDFTHKWTGKKWVKKKPAVIPTAKQVNRWSLQGMGHDGLNQWICVEARAKKLGIYGKCTHCKGHGEIWRTPEDKKAADEWKATEPPKGDWYQIWETTSEGSPISPAFETPEELANWLVNNKASSFGSDTASYDQWLKFIKGPGWAPSGVIANGRMMSGVEAVVL